MTESANLDLVRSNFEASNRGDLDAVLSHYAPDAVWDMSAMGLGTFNGRRAIRNHFEDWFAPYEEFAFKVEQVRDLGNGVVFGVVHEQARMRGASAVIPRHVAFVWEFRDGLIVRVAPYTGIDEARAAAERLAQERGYAVSRANMQIVLDSYPRLNTGESLGTFVPQFYHPDAEWHVASEDPDSAVHHGIEAIRKHIETWIDAYPDQKIEPLEGRANGDQVFVWVRFVGRGAASGAGIEMKLGHVFTLRDGKCARVDVYYDRDEALKAMGLEK